MIQKVALILINVIFGSMVLLSYYNGLTKEPQLSAKLWGGVPSILHPIIITFMFISAVGYFFFTYNFLFNVDANKIFFLNRFNYWSLHILYLLILIPSMLWIKLTFKYMMSGNSLDWIFVVIALSSVAIASIFLFLFTIDLNMIAKPFIYLTSIIGVSIFTFHTLFLDGFIWIFFFNKTN